MTNPAKLRSAARTGSVPDYARIAGTKEELKPDLGNLLARRAP